MLLHVQIVGMGLSIWVVSKFPKLIVVCNLCYSVYCNSSYKFVTGLLHPQYAAELVP